MTHEETVTFHFSELGSYRDLPKILYHFQTKGRDEPRPRGGLLRVREFVMKDAYTFDRDEAGLDVGFQKHARAYERIFDRCELDVYAVQAESGMMGGSESIDYLAPSGSGENTLVTCANGDYAADLEIARGVPRAPSFPERLDRPFEVATPGIATIDELAGFLGIDPAATSKAMPVTKDDGTVVLALVRGDDRLEEAKLAAALGAAFRLATEDEIRAAFGADPGSLGPVGFTGRDRRRRRAARGAVRRGCEPHRLAPARASSTAATSRPGSPTSASPSRATRARPAVGASGSRPRSRSVTSSSSAPGIRRRSVQRSWTRTARSSPC